MPYYIGTRSLRVVSRRHSIKKDAPRPPSINVPDHDQADRWALVRGALRNSED